MIRILHSVLYVAGFLLFGFLHVQAQPGSVKGTIRDPSGQPVQYANVLLIKSSDSSLVKGRISDAAGNYHFENIKEGAYYILASFTGMNPISKSFEMASDKIEKDNGVLYMKKDTLHLKNITVAVKRPMFEQKVDRMIINVKNSITNAGGTALDVLEKSPGVSVNRQNNSIAINGKNGVTVMINGKINYMPMDALVQLLAATSAGNIEKIELISSPPSKYDAGGNAGFINIILINNPYEGFNGSYFLTAGFGKRELGTAGVNFNYRNGKINLYGSYALNYEHTIQTAAGFTQFTRSGHRITNTTFSYRDCKREVQNLRIGMDYQVDSSTSIGILLSGYINHWSMVANNGATISKNNMVDTIITTTDDPEFNRWQNVMSNLHFQHTFKPRKTLFMDVNYIYFKDDNPNTYSTDYYSNAKELLFHEDSRSGKLTPIQFRVFSADYTTPLGKKITMDAGAKIVLSDFNNDVSAENLKGNTWITNPHLSSNYFLKENIGAVYTSFTMNTDSKVSVTAGLRYEFTKSDLSTKERANIVNRKYGELFPTFYASKKLNERNSINFSYSRRITRPAFSDLAPFTVFFDPKTYFSGNPGLQPAIANSIQAGYLLKNFIFTVGYTHEVNTIDNFYFQTQRLDTVSNMLYLSARNFNYQQYLSATIAVPFVMTNWWSMQNNINVNWRQINTTYEKTPAVLRNFDYHISSTQRVMMSENSSVEVTGFFSSPTFLGTAKRKAFYQLDAGLQKKLNNKKDILRFTATDIFNTGGDYRFVENLPIAGASVNRNFHFGLVAYKITFTHNFGNNVLRSKRERSTGAEDELKRVRN